MLSILQEDCNSYASESSWRDYRSIYCDPTGHFPHNPEPLKEHLTVLSESNKENADFGIIVDPDVDRLAFVDENGVVW